MKLSAEWLREFVNLEVDDRQLASDLTSAGIAVEAIEGSGADTVFDMEIGTNRPDAMNHYGVAREASAIYDRPLKTIQPRLPEAAGRAGFMVEVAETRLCPRFTARVLRGVTIRPSPPEIARRLERIDQRPINSAVDATNYTLWEMGKPTHAFDLDRIEGGRLLIRRAHPGETLKTLDAVERKLTEEDLVVADAVKPVALAGVMGGFDTMITEQTRNVLIESAWWDPVTVRKTAKRHGLHTDASHRFERGADFESTVLSCDRVAELILRSGGELQGGVMDVVASRLDQAAIVLRPSEVARILGVKLENNEIVRILERLGFELVPEPGEEAEFMVRVPSWRLDVEREIDLIEEVARLYGYNRISATLPDYGGGVTVKADAEAEQRLRSCLLGFGYHEAVSLTFASHDDVVTFASAPVIELSNPLSEEASVMRTSLLPGMLDMLAYNLNRGTDNVRLFELGSVFVGTGSTTREPRQACLGATGSAVAAGLQQPARPLNFYDLKGDVEKVLDLFEHPGLTFDAQTPDYYHPGRSARVMAGGAAVARFGQVHPDVAARRKLRQEILVAEFDLEALYALGLRRIRYEPLPKFPAVERDFSFVFPDTVAFESIRRAAVGLGLREMRAFVPVEIFRGGSVPAHKYSLLLRATFQSKERTLREEEVAQWSAAIIAALEATGGTQRA